MPSPTRALRELERAPLDELISTYPAEWSLIGPQLEREVKRGPSALQLLVARTHRAATTWSERVTRSHRNPQVIAAALPELAKARMTSLAVERVLQSAATGVDHGVVRLGLLSGLLVQHLFFAKGLERKPASLTAFRWLWPLVRDRRFVMPLVQQRGIYCFYSSELIRRLASLIGGRSALEIAAGDGTLSRFLRDAGAPTIATDDHSWSHAVTYPSHVERLDAVSALERHQPKVVLCSFPPPNNTFERKLLARRDVETYVVITTRHRFAAGDWTAYERATGWTWHIDEALSSLVLPPQLDPAVLVFTRG